MDTIFFKVLWVDDQNLDSQHNITNFFLGYQVKADNHKIELVPYDNWEEAEAELRKNFDEYSSIILDANCKIHKDDIEQSEFITAVLPSLTNIFAEKRKVLPWYLLSAGQMGNFDSIVKGANYQHTKYEEDWGKMLYMKDNPEEKSLLFENIQRIAEKQSSNIVLYRHSETFQYLGENKLIDQKARKIMLRMLGALYYPEEKINFQYDDGNPIRKVIEYLFRSARKMGLLPEECFDGDNVKMQLASLFMAGANVQYDNSRPSEKVRWGDESERIFPNEVSDILKYVLFTSNFGSHTTENEQFIVDESRKELFLGCVLQLCHIIKWYGKYVNEHSDADENKKQFRHIIIDSLHQRARSVNHK